jgi:hypothetical protein
MAFEEGVKRMTFKDERDIHLYSMNVEYAVRARADFIHIRHEFTRFLVLINSGGIGLCLTYIAISKFSTTGVLYPLLFFVGGLFCVGWGMRNDLEDHFRRQKEESDVAADLTDIFLNVDDLDEVDEALRRRLGSEPKHPIEKLKLSFKISFLCLLVGLVWGFGYIVFVSQ